MKTLGKFILLLIITYNSFAWSNPGCKYARELYGVAKISSDAQATSDAFYLTLIACSGKIVTNDILRYPNGKIATYNFGKASETWYYSNGQPLTYSMGQQGQTWYYPNGQTVTYFSYQLDKSWYYDNKKLITRNSGNLSANQYNYEGKEVHFSRTPFPLLDDQNNALKMEEYLVHLYHVKYGASYYYRPLLPTLDL